MDPQWFVLHTKTHVEADVERRLAREETAVFLPRIVANVRAGRHRQTRVLPMFPGYLFVQTDVSPGGRRVRYTPGVHDFLRSDGEPHPVPPEIIETLRTRLGETGIFTPPPPRFEPGARLRIQEGPLEGIEVIFERELSGPQRVAVLLAAMNLPARVVLSSEQLAL